MSADPSPRTPPGGDAIEVDELKQLGYTQVLHRTMGVVRSTMVNISISSVTTAIFTLFAFGLLTGGTAFIWTWAVGFFVLLLVTLCFAELGSSMPIAGALYQWSSRLVGPRYGYAVGWLYVASQIAITAAVAFGIAPFVGSLFGWTLDTGDQALVAVVIVLASTLINLAGVAIASAVGAVGAVSEVVGMLVITVVLIATGITNQSPAVLFHSGGGLPPGFRIPTRRVGDDVVRIMGLHRARDGDRHGRGDARSLESDSTGDDHLVGHHFPGRDDLPRRRGPRDPGPESGLRF